MFKHHDKDISYGCKIRAYAPIGHAADGSRAMTATLTGTYTMSWS